MILTSTRVSAFSFFNERALVHFFSSLCVPGFTLDCDSVNLNERILTVVFFGALIQAVIHGFLVFSPDFAWFSASAAAGFLSYMSSVNNDILGYECKR